MLVRQGCGLEGSAYLVVRRTSYTVSGLEVLIAWTLSGAGIGAYAARAKGRSIGVGVVVGATLGPFALLLLLARRAGGEGPAPARESSTVRVVGYIILVVVLYQLAACLYGFMQPG